MTRRGNVGQNRPANTRDSGDGEHIHPPLKRPFAGIVRLVLGRHSGRM